MSFWDLIRTYPAFFMASTILGVVTNPRPLLSSIAMWEGDLILKGWLT